MQNGRKNYRVVLNSRPVGLPSVENFRLEAVPIPALKDGDVLVKVHYLSLDPYMRRRMDDRASYASPVALGEVMVGGTVGEVIESNHSRFKKGDMVEGMGGWQHYAALKGDALRKIDSTIAPVSTALGILGMPGMTAYTGLLSIGRPQQGETLVVAAASGAVGAAVGQIAKLKGCRVVGIAGGAKKTRYLKDELGFDAALDHKDPDFAQALKAACPKGVDIYFENVGGYIFKTVLPLLNPFARIPVCGLIAHANDVGAPEGPDHVPELFRSVLTKKLSIRGFIVHDFADMASDFYKDMGKWVQDGIIRYKEDIVNGLEHAPEAFIGLLQGRNFGKLLIKMNS
jgi:NADPH-dependent curcumin reductase CurA